MEAALHVSSSSPQPPRKEWRAVPELSSFSNGGSEDLEHVKLVKSDERTIYEEGEGALEVDFCSITIDGGGGLSDKILQQRLQEIARKRMELHHLEVELRAQAIARAEILEVQNSFQAQIKEQADSASKIKDQLQETEQQIHALEKKLDEKERELRAVKLDNEAAWAKDDLLREQNKELATFRRERDSSEAERAEHLKQIHELQEHIQQKENQILALEEQQRVAQDTILFKDEQLREAQTWIARVQEMDALQSTTMQAELRERTEQFNQYWIGIQRQFAEVEHHHLQTIQKLQLELAEAREHNGRYKESATATTQNSVGSSSNGQSKGSQINADGSGISNDSLEFMANGNLEGHSYSSSTGTSSKNEHAARITVVPPAMLGMGTFIPQNQMAALHPFVMHPQGVPQPIVSSSSPVPQPHASHFQPMSAIPSYQQAVQDVSQSPKPSNYQPSQAELNILNSDAHYKFNIPLEGEVIHSEFLNTHSDQKERSSAVIKGSNTEKEVLESNGKQYQTPQEPQQISNANANTSFHPTLVFASPEKKSEIKVQDQITDSAINEPPEQLLASGQQLTASIGNCSAASCHTSTNNMTENSVKVVTFPEAVSTARTLSTLRTVETSLLDERSLLACIVRAVPAGADGRIRISTTLPNRLGKMLAPLHWHDYRKRYGKLDDFVAHHPELFVIEGDFIHLREGAQEIISATTAFAKVAAAAATSTPYSSLFPSVALTPVAQSNRPKTVHSIYSKPSGFSLLEGVTASKSRDPYDKHQQISKHNQQPNGVSFNMAKGSSDMNVLVRSKNLREVNGLASEIRPHTSVQSAVGNGASKGLSNGRLSSAGNKQARSSVAGTGSRR